MDIMAGMTLGIMDIGDMGRIGGPDMAGMIPGPIHITAGIIPDIMVIGGLVAEHTTLIMAIPEEVALHIMGL